MANEPHIKAYFKILRDERALCSERYIFEENKNCGQKMVRGLYCELFGVLAVFTGDFVLDV